MLIALPSLSKESQYVINCEPRLYFKRMINNKLLP